MQFDNGHRAYQAAQECVYYEGLPLTMQDWDLGPVIYRCITCEYQWYTVAELEVRDGYTICPHCDTPITKLDRPHWYTEPVTVPAKAPPASHVDQ